MKKWKQSLLQIREDGMEAIEGLLVITLTLFVLFFIWGYGFLLFQQFVVVHAANETANKIAQTYAYTEADPISGYISKEMKASLSPSRYQDKKIETANEQRGKRYARWVLRTGSFANKKKFPLPHTSEMSVEVKTVYDGYAQRHVVVKIAEEYQIPFGNFLEYFGINGTRVYYGTGRAVCTDISYYLNTINYVKTMDKAVGNAMKNDIVTNAESFVSLYEKFKSFIHKHDDD